MLFFQEQQTAMSALAMNPSLSLGGSSYTYRPDKYVDSPPPSPTEHISSPPTFPDENCARSHSSSEMGTAAENEPKHTGPTGQFIFFGFGIPLPLTD